MKLASCIPIIPSADLEKSLRLWVDGLGFTTEMPMQDEQGKLIFCMLRQGPLHFMLNQRAGSPEKPDTYEGIRLYWAADDLKATRQHLLELGYGVSEVVIRDYGQAEFFLTDADGFIHCFGVPADQL